MCAEFKKRHEIVHQQLNAIAGIDCPRGAGAFYLFPDVSACIKDKGLADDIEFCDELLQQEGVALVPGTAFGAPNCVRVSFAASLTTMNDALNRIERFCLA
jgi:aspartate aminotransferase